MRCIRKWAMPSPRTFQIPPIKDIIVYEIEKVRTNGVVVDPFARDTHFATVSNDLDESFNTDYHMDALEFLKMLPSEYADMVLYDPPYSPRQASECYRKVGREKLTAAVTNSGYWASCRDEVARITRPLGTVITCGWNSNGIGISRGFELDTVLLVAHGGGYNDTIVTVERKLGQLSISGMEDGS